MNTEETVDYKVIALELAQRLNFAIQHFQPKGGGAIYNEKTGSIQGWREYFADGLEMLPGVKVDREILNAMYLPRAKRNKEIQRIKDQRAADKAAQTE